MDDSQNRSSGLPRLSRLPLPRPTSGIPKPVSALPRPTSLRPAPSRESLVTRSNTTTAATSAAATDGRNQRLRNSVSRDHLRSSIGSGDGPTPRLRASVSRDQLRSSTLRAPAPKVKSQPPVAFPRASSIGPSSQRRSSSTPRKPNNELSPELQSPSPDSDTFIIPRRLTLTRRPSEVSTMSPILDPSSSSYEASSDGRPASSSTEESSAFETIKFRSSMSRPSLSERTMETLAQIPSSPAVRKKSSAFFDQPRPKSRGDSVSSRPGSSYNSDGSTRFSSKTPSRPGSSADHRDSSFASFRSSTTFKAPPTSSDGPPRRLPPIQTGRTPNSQMTPVRASMPPPARILALDTPSGDDMSSPSPKNRSTYGNLHARAGSQTVAARPMKKRTSIQGLQRKPSLPAFGQPAGTDASRNVSSNSSQSVKSSWDGSIPSVSSASTLLTADSAEPSLLSNRKSSAALREHIAKAKAAKRAAIKQSAASEIKTTDQDTLLVPVDDGFDFGVSHDDPFNLRKGESPSKKVLSQRVSAARTTGRLNIAAMGLKEIPLEVLKMYELESIGTYDGSWAESVDLTRFVAADNEFETLDDFVFPDSSPESLQDEEGGGNIFGGLETLDLHGNLLVSIPIGFRRLSQLTSLNLSSNRLTNNTIDTIGQMTSLRDLKLANNLLYGPLSWSISNLTSLEILDLHGNNVSALPRNIGNMSRLRILNLNENSFEALPFDGLARLPLTELLVKKNKLSGTLIEDAIESLPHLQTLDASSNQLTRLVPLGSAIDLPVLHALSLSMNRLQGLPDMTSWTGLLTLTVDENSLSSIPHSFTSLTKLRHADFASNDIRVIPPEIARMDNLSLIRLSGNPLRDKKFVSMTTDELKEALEGRLEPPPPSHEHRDQASITDMTGAFGHMNMIANTPTETATTMGQEDEDGMSDVDDDFATPPTSVPQSPRSRSQTLSSLRSRSQTLSSETWPVKAGGLLDRSRTESSSLHPVICSRIVSEQQVKQVHLQHNLFTAVPNSLSFFAETLTLLSMASNQMVGETYIQETIELPMLRELNLSSNHITSMAPLTKFLHAPVLEKLDISLNRINALPLDLKEAFPDLKMLLVNNNHLIELDPDAIRGLRIVDASSNDITHLNPRIGLLGGQGGLEKLDVMGNRFRVPRWNVLERGTEATLRWLRGRVPIAEMAVWRTDNSDDGTDDTE
ncbi:Leucine-rich repeat-containing protein 40 [Paramyrothecium foliicola]|nr:Leucine-rich repeat-containing protein 40 [Paramyrothecium foliicola]